jgi:FAD-NAD(P)-binding
LIEPGPLGVGVHDREQPDYLLLNTVAAQITAFSDERMVPGAPVTRGPGFLEWCRERDLGVPAGWWAKSGRRVEGSDFLPRRIYGEYLAWAAEELLRRVPPNLRVTIVQAAAVDVRPKAGAAEICLDDGSTRLVDLAIVTTGHGLASRAPQPAGDATWIDRPYPLPQSLAGVGPGQRLAILGSGLTAIDLIASVTVGRGGTFHADGDGLSYSPSGSEPEVVLVNRSGWLPCARPASPRLRPAARRALEEGIERLRRDRRDGLLDLAGDLEPLIWAEVFGGVEDDREALVLERAFVLREPPAGSEAEFHDAVIEQARLDVEEARLGLGRSRLKERMETLRDQREALRMAVDPPGMTRDGHRGFFERIPALANRTAVGPQRERMEELLRLIEQGVVRLGPGRRPEVRRRDGSWELRSTSLREEARFDVDLVVKGHLEFPESDAAIDPLASALRRWVAPHPANPRFLCLDRRGHPLTRKGGACEAVAVFGPPAEGANYYNNYILWPGAWSRLLTDLDRVLVCATENVALD